jgi:hypothetical protein
MKKIRINFRAILFSLVAISILASCTKLDDKNYLEVLSQGFSPNEEDVAAITAEGYGGWRKILLFWNGYWRVQENSADEIVTPPRPNGWVDGGIYRRMHKHTWVNSDDISYQTWARTYSAIANCNRIIYQIESGFLPLTTTKQSVIAELKVLRASYYYVLCDMYGNVPIVTKFDVPEGYLPEQNTRKEVYDFIISEITGNIKYLSTTRGGVYYGRFNQWAARTLLAKMYLNAEVYSGTAHWAECINQCDSVINSGAGYGLEDDQKSVFATENQGSKEIIYGLAIDNKYTTDWNTFDIHMQSLQPANQATYNLTQTPWGGMCAIPQFIDTFDPEDSRLTKNYIYGQQYSSSGDALNCTMGDYAGKPLAYINVVLPMDQTSQEIHGYRFGKFEIAKGSTNILNNDYPLFRYADILMMKAECLLRTGDANGAAAIVSQVRARAFKANPSKAIVTGADLQKGSVYNYGLRDVTTTNEGGTNITYGRFLDELGWEFNQEGRRRQDMIRFGVFTTKSWLSHSALTDNHTVLYPVPLTILESNTKLKQNTGY